MLRGEVWLINLSPTLGAEMQKTLPPLLFVPLRCGKG